MTVPHRDPREGYVASSIQFNVDHTDLDAVVERAAARGVTLKWFGADQPTGFASRSDHWRYAPEQSVPQAREVLESLIDMRIPLTMTATQADQIVAVIAEAVGPS